MLSFNIAFNYCRTAAFFIIVYKIIDIRFKDCVKAIYEILIELQKCVCELIPKQV